MKALMLLAGLLTMTGNAVLRGESADAGKVNVMLFVPAGVQVPAGYQQRIDEIVGYAEAFFRGELGRWGHSAAIMPFQRGATGRVIVTIVRGKEPASNYKPVAIRSEVMAAMRREGRLRGGRDIWWILVYEGEPPARFEGFVGGFGAQIGGWAVCNLDTTPGRIDPAAPLGSEFVARLALKGMIHELGHGFGLPHVGPLERDRAGNTLMGPTHINFRRLKGFTEERAYLSEAEAAMLATHPAFRGTAHDPAELPKVEVQGLTCGVNWPDMAFIVKGRIRASKRPVYALVADEADNRPGEYWTKTYAGKVAADGSFQVNVTEPARCSGTLRTWFIFENGAQTGDGRRRGRTSGIPTGYTYRDGQWVFDSLIPRPLLRG